MQIHDIKRNTKNRKKAYVGRGGKRGKTSGKGTKGQNSRSGRKRPELRDIIKKLPKLRGYRFNSIERTPVAVNLEIIEKNFNAGDIVSPETLSTKKLIKKDLGKTATVKILGMGTLTKKVTITGCSISASAKEAVEKAGGTITK